MKHVFSWLIIMTLILSAGVCSHQSTTSASDIASHHYQLREICFRGWSVYRQLKDFRPSVAVNTNHLTHQLVVIKSKQVKNGQTYFLIQYQGKTYGWLDAKALKQPRSYVLPYHYYSQLFPLWAPEACEAASLKIALSVKGRGQDDGLQYIINRMPRSVNSEQGFSGNPYKDNSGIYYWLNLIHHGFNTIFGQTIYPKPLTKYARHYDSAAQNITGASKQKLIDEIKHGNAVVFVGSFQMRLHTNSYHILTLVGYRPGQFLVADPYRYWHQSHRVFWISTHHFIQIFSNRLRKRRAVAV